MKFVSLAHRTYKKLGNQVMYNLFGYTVARAYVPKFKNPNTDAQQLVRAKFSLLTEYARQFAAPVALGYKAKAAGEKMYPRNMFIARNYSKVTGSSAAAVNLDYSQIECANGPVAQLTLNPSLNTTTPGSIVVSWTDGWLDDPAASNQDKVFAYVFCADAGIGVLSEGVLRARTGSVEVSLPSFMSGLEVHVYVFVIGGAQSTLGESSPTMYAGHAEVG